MISNRKCKKKVIKNERNKEISSKIRSVALHIPTIFIAINMKSASAVLSKTKENRKQRKIKVDSLSHTSQNVHRLDMKL